MPLQRKGLYLKIQDVRFITLFLSLMEHPEQTVREKAQKACIFYLELENSHVSIPMIKALIHAEKIPEKVDQSALGLLLCRDSEIRLAAFEYTSIKKKELDPLIQALPDSTGEMKKRLISLLVQSGDNAFYSLFNYLGNTAYQDVIEEVLYLLDVPANFAANEPVPGQLVWKYKSKFENGTGLSVSDGVVYSPMGKSLCLSLLKNKVRGVNSLNVGRQVK